MQVIFRRSRIEVELLVVYIVAQKMSMGFVRLYVIILTNQCFCINRFHISRVSIIMHTLWHSETGRDFSRPVSLRTRGEKSE